MMDSYKWANILYLISHSMWPCYRPRTHWCFITTNILDHLIHTDVCTFRLKVAQVARRSSPIMACKKDDKKHSVWALLTGRDRWDIFWKGPPDLATLNQSRLAIRTAKTWPMESSSISRPPYILRHENIAKLELSLFVYSLKNIVQCVTPSAGSHKCVCVCVF